MTMNRSKSKPEVEFQYGVHLFSETGSSNNSAVYRDIPSKFGMQIDLDILKRVPSLNTSPSLMYDGITAPGGLIWMKFGRYM